MGRSTRDKCKRLIELGYDEDTIVSALNMKHKQFRKFVNEPFGTLTAGAAKELCLFDADLSEARAAEVYFVDRADIRRARNGAIRPEASDENVMAWLQTEHCKTEKELYASLRSKFGLRKDKATAVLKRLGFLANYQTCSIKRSLIKSMLQKGVARTEIPGLVKCSRSYVTMVAKELNYPTKPCKRLDNWDEVIAFAKATSNSEAARAFNVSRQAVIYQRKKVVCADKNS